MARQYLVAGYCVRLLRDIVPEGMISGPKASKAGLAEVSGPAERSCGDA